MNQDPTQTPTHPGFLPPEPLITLQLEVLFLNPECAQYLLRIPTMALLILHLTPP